MELRQDPSPRMWLTRRAIFLHLTVAIAVPLFIGLFWWQVQRVREGNTLSWAYVFEWPFFTGYAVYLWWKLVHEQPEVVDARAGTAPGEGPVVTTSAPATATASSPDATRSPAAAGAPPTAGSSSEEDEELAAYNRYLAELNATGRPKHW